MKHTHIGHCQACGRIQATHAVTGLIAKHGYTVEFSYFSGVCSGSGHMSLQIERIVTDSHIELIGVMVHNDEVRIKSYEDGSAHPNNVGAYIGPYRPLYNKAEQWGSRRVQAEVSWDNASPFEREQGMKNAIWGLKSNVQQGRSAIQQLTKLAEQIHGTALIKRKD
jgi:hypothetical protein